MSFYCLRFLTTYFYYHPKLSQKTKLRFETIEKKSVAQISSYVHARN